MRHTTNNSDTYSFQFSVGNAQIIVLLAHLEMLIMIILHVIPYILCKHIVNNSNYIYNVHNIYGIIYNYPIIIL